MVHVAVVGGGPAGLSAALFAAKNGLDVTVFDTDETWMHKAHLFNYLGVDSIDGSSYIDVARKQAERFGADLKQGTEVTDVSTADGGFSVAAGDEELDADYVVLATGANRDLAEDLGCETTDDGVVDVDVTMETSVDDAYATGAMVRAEEWQAVISAGDGAAAALNVLTKEKGEHYHDFDVPADADAVAESLTNELDD
ncbi:NAD(P)/FAD-dependent oxidoreductase [Halobaculum sp. D14]|uniref:NAD(P)/FAD-dependent oxidoreductase n=1 Tax=unclassified Halobaculum TaxID=2640896 RepID=UPI003EBC43A5